MKTELKSTRFHERKQLQIPLTVFYPLNGDQELVETTLTEQVTICGLGFMMSQPIEPKRLVHFELPMPKSLRLFDHSKEQYDVWGVVRYLKLIESGNLDKIQVMVGAALIGGKPPVSFLTNPKTFYDLKPFLREQSFWDSRELPRTTGPYIRSVEERQPIETQVIIKTIDDTGQIIEVVEAETINISESGAAILTNFTSEIPKYVLMHPADKNVSLLAAVRSHKLDSSNLVRLHLEFISGKWLF
jgi:hypothetical protein